MQIFSNILDTFAKRVIANLQTFLAILDIFALLQRNNIVVGRKI